MWVIQFWELGEDFHHLVRTFTTGGDDHDVSFRLLGNGMLKHRLTRTEWARNEACTAFHNGVEGINRTHTRFEQFERTWFFLIVRHGKLYRPVLHHVHLHFCAVLLFEYSHHIVNLIFASRHDALHLCLTFHLERSHNLQFLRVLFHLAEPCRAFHLVAHLGKWNEIPLTILVEWFGVLATLQEDTFHLVEVILQTIIILGQHAWTQLHFKHVSCTFGWCTNSQSTC